MNTRFVVAAFFYALAAELFAKYFPLLLVFRAPPLLDSHEHRTTSINRAIVAIVTEIWVVKDTIDNSSKSAIDIDALVIPTRNELRDDPLQDLACNFTRWFIEHI